MIKTPTVLILGAGASMPYYFPSGEELFYAIYNNLKNGPNKRALLISLGFPEDLTWGFINSLFASGKSSVDEFLEHRPEFLDVGKAAIALELIKYENEDHLFGEEIQNQNWYKYLFGALNTSFEEFGENKISIITYNYDRSLEHFLITALQKSYGKTEIECAAELQKIPIIHLHGKLGRLPWQGSNSRKYDPDIKPEMVEVAYKSIKIIYEGIHDDIDFKHAHEILQKAKYIYFLGFGYNKTNLGRLNINSWSGPAIFGSSKGLTTLQRKGISAFFGERNFNICDVGYDVINFLKNIVVFR